LFVACALVALLSSAARAQDITIEMVAAEALQADSVRDWRMLLALAHPEALLEYRKDQLQVFAIENFPIPPSANPCFTKRFKQYGRFLLDSVYRVPSADSLSRLAPESVFARNERFMARRLALHVPIDSFAPIRVIIGHVLADDSTAYVVLEDRYPRLPLPDWPERRAEIMTLRKYRGAWRSMLDPDLGAGTGSLMSMGEDACD